MLFSDDMTDLVTLLQRHNVRFAVCGGFAVAHYGFVRATMDLDLLVLPGAENAKRIMAALNDFGFGKSGITEEAFMEPGAAISLGAQPNQVDLLTSMSDRSTDDILSNAGSMQIKGLTMKVVSYDDLLHAKKTSGRPKDLIDFEELTRLGERS